MPGQTRSPTVEAPTPAPAETQAPAVAQAAGAAQAAGQPAGNAAEQEALRGKEGTATGLESYQNALGNWLGGELYKAVAPHLTFEAMQKYANQGLEEALKGGVGLLGGLEGQVDKAAIGAFGKALAEQYGNMAGQWLDTDGGRKLTGGLADWVDTNPRLIVLIALLAAGGAVLANMDIPTIKQKFKIAKGLTAEVEAELGKLRAVALEEIKAKLQYESGPLLAAVQVQYGEKDGFSGKAEVGVSEKDSYSVKGNVEFTQDGIKAWGANASMVTGAGTVAGEVTQQKDKDPVIKGSLTRGDGKNTTVDEISYDANTDVFTFKDTRNFLLDGGTKASVTNGFGTDGSQQQGFNLSGNLNPNLKLNAGFDRTTAVKDGQSTTTEAATAGLDYNNQKGLQLGLNSKLLGDGSGSLSANGSYKPNDNWSFNANAGLDFGKEDQFKLGGSMAYQDAATRSKFMLSGSYASKDNAFEMNALAQRNLTDDFALRGTAGFKTSDQGSQFNAGLHGAYFLNKDTALIGGGRYELDAKGQSHFIPEVGAQIKGIPLTVGYDTQTGGWRVGAQISF